MNSDGASDFTFRGIAIDLPILMAYPDARIDHFDASGINEVSYWNTEHFSVAHDFLDPDRMMQVPFDQAN